MVTGHLFIKACYSIVLLPSSPHPSSSHYHLLTGMSPMEKDLFIKVIQSNIFLSSLVKISPSYTHLLPPPPDGKRGARAPNRPGIQAYQNTPFANTSSSRPVCTTHVWIRESIWYQHFHVEPTCARHI